MKSTLSLSLFAALVFAFAPTANANGCNNNHPPCPPPHCDPQPPTLSCDAGGPYNIDASLGVVSVQLDGTDSAGATSWFWTVNYPGAFFDDRTLPNPTLTIPVTCDCSFNVNISLTVRRDNQTRTCCTTVRLRDHVPPKIFCPAPGKLTCGDDTSPAALGFATATDNCDQHVQITYHDTIQAADCDARRFDHVIQRRWRAVDNDCNVATCVQTIDVVKVVASADIMPGACPNTYNRNASSLLSIAILGDANFDVTQIQWNSVKIYGLDCSAGPVSAHSYELADRGTPYVGQDCGCHDLNGDGRLDLIAKFQRSRINDAFGLCNAAPGTQIPVIIVGRLNCGGCKFIAQDCMVVQ